MEKQMIFVLAVIFAVSSLCGAENIVVNPGFETPETTGGGWPSSYGDWNGDYSSIVGASAGIVPLEGSKMLKLSGSSHGGSGGSANSCQVFQIIDVSAYAQEISDGKVSVAASAYFNRIAGDTQTDTKFYVCIYAYAGEPSTFPTQWEPPNSNHGILARATGFVYSDGNPATWEQGQVQLALPTNTDFVVIGVNAQEDIYNDYSLPEFDGHFADDVYAEVIIPVLVGLEITGPNQVPEDSQTQYSAIALYDNNSTADVTDTAIWSVEPNVIADINAGLLTTEKIFQPEAVTITAQYTEDGNTFDANEPVSLFAICPSGSALQFDGVNDYVNCGSSSVYKILGDMTVSFWFKREHTLLAWPSLVIIEEGAGDPENAAFYTRILGGSSSLADIRYIHEYNGGLNQTYDFNVDLELGYWTHIAIVRDSYQKKVEAYKDGVLVETFSYTYNPTAVSSELITTIGARSDLASSRFLKGSMDDVRIYDRAVSAQEMQMIMRARPAVDEPNLVGYWDFDEGEGQVAYDMSGNGNDGQLGSSPDIDDSDPAWVDSDAPVGICTPEGLVERNVNEALEIKLNILDEILEALAREDASVNILSDLFGEAQYGHLDKRDIIKAKQEIHSAIQGEEQAIDSLEKSAGDLEDSLEALSGQNNSPETPPARQSKTLVKPTAPAVSAKPTRK